MIEIRDSIEFYGPESRMVAGVRSSIVPPVGALINIRKKTWQVSRVTYCVDHADNICERGMRVNVDLVEPSQAKQVEG